jgi:5,10-methylenetetrahydrofolate reductase
MNAVAKSMVMPPQNGARSAIVPNAETTEEANEATSTLEALLRDRQFVITAEMSPPDSAAPADVYERVRSLDGYVDCINATDASGANVHISSLAVSLLLQREGHCPVMQISCRDRNRIAIQGDVLGASALGITNILCLTGDGVQTGDHPEARPVFDLDSIALLSMLRTMRDEKRYLSGRPLKSPPNIFLGAAENPSSLPLDMRVARLKKKVEAGAQFIQTQYCFDMERLRDFMKCVRDIGLDRQVHILVGVGPLASPGAARWMRSHVPGVHIPDHVIRRLEGAAKPKEEGRRICIEIMQEVSGIHGISGVHVMAFKQEQFIGEMVEAAGILGTRRPASRKQVTS